MPILNTQREILDQEQAADYTRLSVSTLESLRTKGGGPAYSKPTPGRVVYLRSDLLDWVKMKRVDEYGL